MGFNFGKLVKKLLSRKRNDVTAHAKAPVIEQPIVTAKKVSTNGKNGHTQNGGRPLISRVRRKMERRSRTLNSMRRRGKLCV